MVVLEGNRERIVSPIREVIRELDIYMRKFAQLVFLLDLSHIKRGGATSVSSYLPKTSPLNSHVADDGVQHSSYVVRPALEEHDGSSIIAFIERLENLRHIVTLAPERGHGTDFSRAGWAPWERARTWVCRSEGSAEQ